ncbi:MAG TPA: PIN domain-containing protein [Candidatus Baltobacteraceae bacterium]|nr:PIN domain-containing protein [Candidatus Baltobacteraceae bacterium]
MFDLMIRVALVILFGAAGFLGALLHRGEPSGLIGLLVGLAFGALFVYLERRLRRIPVRTLLLALVGLLVGLFVGRVVAGAVTSLLGGLPPEFQLLVVGLFLCGGGYLGIWIAVEKAAEFSVAGFVRMLKEQPRAESYKLLDTSVIIDGRIADITETGFMEGTLVIPQFILRELQHIADSSDPLKRNRGRRGLDILQKIQKNVDIRVEISDMEFPEIREVDNKLVAMAKTIHAKIVTNDFNLNKVAELHGVGVLNINELTNALRPVVLPGEDIRVYILKEGKEYNQGIAYLDDGTMVVVDNGRRHIGQTMDVCVTSVLQTTAGRMIFSRLKEEAEAA